MVSARAVNVPDLHKRSLRASVWLCAIAAIFPVLAVVGWLAGIPALASINPSFPPLQPMSAAGLLLVAVAVLLTGEQPGAARFPVVALGAAAGSALIGFGTLGEYAFGWNIDLDQLFLQDGSTFGRLPSPQTAGTLVVCSAAITSYHLRRVSARIGQACALAVTVSATLAMTGYIFGAPQFYGFPFLRNASGMAVTSAISFFLLSLALLCTRPGVGLMSLVTADSRSGAMARRLLLVSILVVPVVGVATRIGLWAGWYGSAVEISLFAILSGGLVVRTMWQTARRSEREEMVARAALDATTELNEELHAMARDRRLFSALVENSPDFIGIADPGGKPLYLNPAGRRMIGLSAEHDGPLQLADCYTPDQQDFARDVILKSTLQQGQWQGVTTYRHQQTGAQIPVSDRHFMIRDHVTGEVLGIATISRDVSDQHRAQAELQLSEAKFSGIVATSADAIVSIDHAQRIILFNEGAERTFGYARADVLGAPIGILIPPRFRAAHAQHVRDFAAEQAQARRMGGGDVMGVRKNGDEFPADVTISKLNVSGTLLMTLVLRDITDQKRLEKEQRLLADAGHVLSSSVEYDRTLLNIAQLIVRDLADFCVVVAPPSGVDQQSSVASRDPSMRAVADLLAQGPLDFHRSRLVSRVLRQQGPVLVEQVSPESLVTSWSSEAQRRAVREADVRSVMAIPLRARGVVVGVLTVASSRRSYGQSDVRLLERFAERAALAIDQARLFADTRRAVGIRDDVLAVVSQDLRAPVVTFGVVEQLLRQTHEADATKLANWADILRRALEEMHLLIDDLMDFARIQSGTFAIDLEGGPLSAVVTPVVDQLRLVAEARQQVLVVDLPDTLPRVRIDRPRLRRVIANLVGNAIKFTGERGRIGVSARQHRNTVVVSVSDNGPGIPPDQAVRVFDRFWQGNRATPAGSGLGLSIAKGIVEAHGGHIWVDSDIGLGAVFSFSLPLDTAVVATVVPRDRISPPVSQSPQA